MKQFEKWWTKHNPQGHVESMGFEMDSDIWKAALEWALDLTDRLGQEACYDIEKELEK